MSRRVVVALLVLASLVLALVWTGVHMTFAYVRQQTVQAGELRQRAVSVPRGDAARVAVHIGMEAGTLNLAGGAAHLLDGYVSANSEWLYPAITYSESGQLGRLTVAHRALDELGSIYDPTAHRAAWDLQLNSSVPLSTLNIALGAQDANLDLRDLQVRAAQVEMLGGTVSVNLAQSWPEDVHVAIRAVSGQLTIHLPKDMGVEVFAEPELGTIITQGLKPLPGPAGRYANAAYGSTPATLQVTANLALGTLRLLAE